MTALRAVATKRLVRATGAWLAIAFWSILAILPAALARGRGTEHGADQALLGFYAAISVPFLGYTALSAILGRDGLGQSGLALANLGASPSRVALHAVTVAILASALLGGILGAAVTTVAHGPLDPPLAVDATKALAAGALGGAAYAAYFALGASFGARGYGRSIFLVIDWLLGSDVSASAVVTPRAHLRSLLGGPAPLDMAGRASYVALGVMVVVFTWLAIARAGRTTWRPARG
jgi:hypothetical protein